MMAQVDHSSLILVHLSDTKWIWACRDIFASHPERGARKVAGQVGDVIVAEVQEIRNHAKLMTAGFGRVRIFGGELIIGVLGDRYATDAFEGQVSRRNPTVRPPMRLKVLGERVDASGLRGNLIERGFLRRLSGMMARNVDEFELRSSVPILKSRDAGQRLGRAADQAVAVRRASEPAEDPPGRPRAAA